MPVSFRLGAFYFAFFVGAGLMVAYFPPYLAGRGHLPRRRCRGALGARLYAVGRRPNGPLFCYSVKRTGL